MDDELTYDEKSKLINLLEKYGELDNELRYRGSGNSGYVVKPGAGTQSGEIVEPMSIEQLLNSEYWNIVDYDPEYFNWQDTMLEPVGGMDKIVDGLMNRVGHLVHYQKEVRDIRNRLDEVRV